MTEQKHTPGPWAVWNHGGGHLLVTCTGVEKAHPNEGMHVAYLNLAAKGNEQWNPMITANAKLIAAAPDLLEALQAFTHEIVPTDPNHHLWVEARAAIAKATQ